MYNEYNIQKEIPQQLIDHNGKKINPWKEKKEKTILLSDSFFRLGDKRFNNVLQCGTDLEFFRYLDDNSLKLNKANFCKERLCPMCAWRRSLKVFGQTSKIMDTMLKENDVQFLFLTLTVKNVYSDDLSNTIDKLFYGIKKMFQYKEIKDISLGTFRGLEVTFNKEEYTFHPHFHIIIAVKRSYFKSKKYLSTARFRELWTKSMNLDYVPQVKLNKIYGKLSSSVSELAKYTVKDSDYLIKDNEPLTDFLVTVFSQSLKNRRLMAYTGIFRKYHKILNLDDTEHGDLINTDNEELRDDINYVIEKYHWNIGIGNYTLYK